MLAVVNQVEQVASFRLAAPSAEVVAADFSTWVNIGTFTNGHVRSRCYERHRWFAWIVSRNPIGNGNVVGSVAKLDRYRTIQADQKLRSAIVESEYLRLW